MNLKKYLPLSLVLLFFTVHQLSSQIDDLKINSGKRCYIPFKNFNNLILIRGSVNGSDTLNFILDTGVRNTIIIKKSLADSLKLNYHSKINLLGAVSDKKVNAYVVNQAFLDLYKIEGIISSLIVLEEDYLQLKDFFGTEIHGILGYDIFRQFIVRIDYSSHLLTFFNPGEYDPGRRWDKIPIKIENGKPYMNAEVTINDSLQCRPTLLVDLGASHSSLFELGSDDALNLPETFIHSNLGRGLGGEIHGFKARIKNITLGKYPLNDVVVNYAFPIDSVVENRQVYRNGTIGGEILARFHVVFDYPNGFMYIKKNKFFKKKFNYNMSGIELYVKGDKLNLFYVNEVAENSPAQKAGIMAGDLILSLNGIKSSALSLDDFNHMFRNKPGKNIKLEILRKNQLLKIQFKLKKEI